MIYVSNLCNLGRRPALIVFDFDCGSALGGNQNNMIHIAKLINRKQQYCNGKEEQPKSLMTSKSMT